MASAALISDITDFPSLWTILLVQWYFICLCEYHHLGPCLLVVIVPQLTLYREAELTRLL
jgi:hypothetical protein